MASDGDEDALAGSSPLPSALEASADDSGTPGTGASDSSLAVSGTARGVEASPPPAAALAVPAISIEPSSGSSVDVTTPTPVTPPAAVAAAAAAAVVELDSDSTVDAAHAAAARSLKATSEPDVRRTPSPGRGARRSSVRPSDARRKSRKSEATGADTPASAGSAGSTARHPRKARNKSLDALRRLSTPLAPKPAATAGANSESGSIKGGLVGISGASVAWDGSSSPIAWDSSTMTLPIDVRDDRSWVDVGKVIVHPSDAEEFRSRGRSLGSRFLRPFADIVGGDEVPWHQVFPRDVEWDYRVQSDRLWRRSLDIGLCQWIIAVLILEIFNEIRPFDESQATQRSNQVGLRWTFVSEMIVVAVMFLVNRWKALPPVYGVLALSFLFAIAAVVMGVFGQVYSAADEPDSLLFLVVFILGPTLPALPFWVCSSMLLVAAIAIIIVDFTNQVVSDEHHLEGANVLMAFTLFVFGIYSSYFVDYYRRFSYLRMRALAKHEKELVEDAKRTRELLLSILPRAIVRSLQRSLATPGADPSHTFLTTSVSDVTIFFTDMVGFTTLSASLPAPVVVELLNELFCEIDLLVNKYKLEKIKTLGDAYMACGGVPLPLPDHADRVVRMALEAIAVVRGVRERTGHNVYMRVGVHTGSVSAGVMGATKFAYDVWSDDVDIASKMESTGRPDQVHLSATTAQHLVAAFPLEPGPAVDLGRLGTHETFFVAALPATPTAATASAADATGAAAAPALEADGAAMPLSAAASMPHAAAPAAVAVFRARHMPHSVDFGHWGEERRRSSGNSVLGPADVPPLAREGTAPAGVARTGTQDHATVSTRSGSDVHTGGLSLAGGRHRSNSFVLDQGIQSRWKAARHAFRFPLLRFRNAEYEQGFLTKIRRAFGPLVGSMAILVFSLVMLTVVDIMSTKPSHASLVAGAFALPIVLVFAVIVAAVHWLTVDPVVRAMPEDALTTPVRLAMVVRPWLHPALVAVLLLCASYAAVLSNFSEVLEGRNASDDMTRVRYLSSSSLVVIVNITSFTHVRAVVLAPLAVLFMLLFIIPSTTAPNISSLFNAHLNQALPIIVIVTWFVCFECVIQEYVLRTEFLLRQQLAAAYQRTRELQNETEYLLLNILPVHIIKRLEDRPGQTIADAVPRVAVLFVSLPNFADLVQAVGRDHASATLNAIICAFDARLAHFPRVEKIKSHGSTYMVAAGLADPQGDLAPAVHPAIPLALFAQSLAAAVESHNLRLRPAVALQFRAGLAVGPCVAGVIGHSKFCFDIWGDTVNVASRMESTGTVGHIQVTTQARAVLRSAFHLKRRGVVNVKGKGELVTYYLGGLRLSSSMAGLNAGLPEDRKVSEGERAGISGTDTHAGPHVVPNHMLDMLRRLGPMPAMDTDDFGSADSVATV